MSTTIDTTIQQNPQEGRQVRPLRLTKREIEVLKAKSDGSSSADIAAGIFVSKRTVDFHLQNIYNKLGVGNALAAIHEARRRGLVDFSEGGAL